MCHYDPTFGVPGFDDAALCRPLPLVELKVGQWCPDGILAEGGSRLGREHHQSRDALHLQQTVVVSSHIGRRRSSDGSCNMAQRWEETTKELDTGTRTRELENWMNVI